MNPREDIEEAYEALFINFDKNGYCNICSSYTKYFDFEHLKKELDFLKSFKDDTSDQYLMVSALPKIEKMLNGNIPEQPLSSYDGRNVHSNGIIAFNF